MYSREKLIAFIKESDFHSRLFLVPKNENQIHRLDCHTDDFPCGLSKTHLILQKWLMASLVHLILSEIDDE